MITNIIGKEIIVIIRKTWLNQVVQFLVTLIDIIIHQHSHSKYAYKSFSRTILEVNWHGLLLLKNLFIYMVEPSDAWTSVVTFINIIHQHSHNLKGSKLN